MANPSWKVKRLRWWNWPVPLYRKDEEGFTKVGWVWNQPAYIIKNIYLGWIAFVEDQTTERLSYLDVWSCSFCGAEICGNKKQAIEGYIEQQLKEKNAND